MSLAPQRLREVLDYDPSTGIFRWRFSRGRSAKGSEAGQDCPNGYRQIGVDGTLYLSHRLAWLYFTGEWPKEFLDHRNRDKSDNRFSNLREATNSQNQMNKKTPSHSKSGIKGVIWLKREKKWFACIKAAGQIVRLGYFDDKNIAALAYRNAAKQMHGEFAHCEGL